MSFGSKNACSWGEEGDICPAYRKLLERPPTRDTELVGCAAPAPATVAAGITSMHCPSAPGGHRCLLGYCVTSYSHPNYTVSSAQ